MQKTEAYGGSHTADLVADLQTWRDCRFYLATPLADNLGVRLPDSAHVRAGPGYLIANGSASRSLAIRNAEGTETLGTLASRKAAWVGYVGGDPASASSWAMGAAEDVGLGSATSIAPTAVELVIGPGIYDNLSIAARFSSETGYPGTWPVALRCTIRKGAIIGSSAGPGTPALDTGSFPSGSTLEIINYGEIRGAGGTGGIPSATAGAAKGQAGGAGLHLQLATNLLNHGIIAGGGGGGSARWSASSPTRDQYGCGGGGAGFPAGSGIPSGAESFASSRKGRSGTSVWPGFGAKGDIGSNPDRLFSAISGGMGGFPGFAGQDALGPDGGGDVGGGPPGAAITGAQFLTIGRTGTIQGATVDLTNRVFTVFVGTYAAAFVLRDMLIALGWNGSSTATATVHVLPGAILYTPRRYRDEQQTSFSGQLFARAALRTGTFPAGSSLTLINEGRIYGYGGWGAHGRSNSYAPGHAHGGGTALELEYATTIDNAEGEIRGGGGGGAGAGNWASFPPSGAGQYGGAGGAGEGAPPIPPLWPFPTTVDNSLGALIDADGRPRDPATIYPAGTVAAERDGRWVPTVGVAGRGVLGDSGYSGGNGGEHGLAGASGPGTFAGPGGTGASAGNAVVGNSFATWTATGLRVGAIS